MTLRRKIFLQFSGIIMLAILAGIIAFPQVLFFAPPLQNALQQLKINLGLDLQGGIHLEYKAETERINEENVQDALEAAQAVIERRVNAFGVSEPRVQRVQSGDEERIIVELPGVKDVNEAKERLQEAPFLEFRERDPENNNAQEIVDSLNEQAKKQAEEVLRRALDGEDFANLAREFSQDPGSAENGGDLGFVSKGTFVPEVDEVLFEENINSGAVYPKLVESMFGWHIIKIEEVRGEGEEKEVRARHILLSKYSPEDFPSLLYSSTELTGQHLEYADVDFGGQQAGVGRPQVLLQFDQEGTDLFAEITKRNIEQPLAIFIDNELVTAPTVQTEISNGQAVITGDYTLEEATELKRRLNEGALPVPLTIVQEQSIDASLGQDDLQKSLYAGAAGLIAVAIYMIAYYRMLGLLATFSLIVYALLLVAIFKLSSVPAWPFPITLTLSGIAGFILSIGMAVDANILIFERTKEELLNGKSLSSAVNEGFRRAWTSIRDGSYSTIITSIILIWFGTGFVQGFATILAIGVLMSLFTAVVVTKTFLRVLPLHKLENWLWIVLRRRPKTEK